MGKIFTITGVSGAGKSTLARGFTLAIPGAKLIISITTRTPRVGDLHGEYSHVSVDEFRELEHEGKFLWTAQYGCTHYGTLVGAVDDVVASSTAVGVMILSPPGVRDLRHHLESGGDIGVHTPVFVTAPPRDEFINGMPIGLL